MSSRSCTILLAVSAVLAACASTDVSRVGPSAPVEWGALWPELMLPEDSERATGDGLFPARRPDAAGFERLKQAEAAWRERDDASFGALRDDLQRDPVLAFWLSRLLIRDAIFLRKRADFDPAALLTVPPWRRPADQLVVMGAAAAPCVVLDLLRDRAVDRNDLGAELLQEMGPSVLPAWRRVFAVDDARVRRYAVRAVAGWEPTPETLVILTDASKDADFGIRAEGFRGLGRGGPEQASLLRAALDSEGDPFARRAIVDGLGFQADRASAERILTFLEDSAAAGDIEGQDAACRSLMRISGQRSLGTVASWRRWLTTWNGD